LQDFNYILKNKNNKKEIKELSENEKKNEEN